MPTVYYHNTPDSSGCWTRWVRADECTTSYSTVTTTYSSATVWDEWSTRDERATYSSTDCIWTVWSSDSPDCIQVADRPDPWITWTSDSTGSAHAPIRSTRYVPADNFVIRNITPEKSVEQVRAEKAQQEINRIWAKIEREWYQAERKEAEDRALELLGDLIGDDQLEIYRETGRLLVHGKKHDWLIRKEGIIAKVEKDKLVDHCVHLKRRSSFPPTDNVITLALRLKDDEKEVEKIANRMSTKNREELKKVANF